MSVLAEEGRDAATRIIEAAMQDYRAYMEP